MSSDIKPPTPPPAARPGAIPGIYPEPSPALKNVLGLRAESDVPENWMEALNEMARQVQERKNAKVPLSEWASLYERAREVVTGVQNDIDGRIANAQSRMPSNEEMTRLQNSLVAEPRKEAEAVRTRIRGEFKRIGDDWKSRIQRQLDHHIREPSLQNCIAGLELQTIPGKGEVTLQLAPPWLGRFNDYLRATCVTWGSQVCSDLEKDLRTAISESTHLGLTGRRGISIPRDSAPPEPEIRIFGSPEAREVVVPTQMEQLFKSLRSGMMLARFIGGLVVTLGGGAVAILAMIGNEDNHTKELLGLAGAALVLLVTPLLFWTAWGEAKKEMIQHQAKETATYRTATERWIKESLDRVLDRHKERLQRQVLARIAEWESAQDLWWDEAVMPALRLQETQVQQKADEMKELSARLTAELNGLRTLRSTVAGQLKAVKIRHQEILDEG